MSLNDEQESKDRGELDGAKVSQPGTKDAEQPPEENGPSPSEALHAGYTVPQTSQQTEPDNPSVEPAGSIKLQPPVDGTTRS